GLTSFEITAQDLRSDVAYLASDALAGRAAGSEGARRASDFIAQQFRQMGLKPVGPNTGYFQDYEFNSGVRVLTNANHLAVGREGGVPADTPFEVDKDFRPLSFTANTEVEGEVVFVGYGLSVPGKPGEGYDSYTGVNVSNKIVLVLRYVPEEVESKR